MSNITELREHLFATLRALRDKEAPMEIDRARAISQVAAAVIDSVRAENDFLRVTGLQRGSGFIPDGGAAPAPDAGPPASGLTGITRHLLKG